MSGFRDTFTKDDTEDEVLGYDDTAFYFFAGSVMAVIVVPWTFNMIYNAVFPEASVETTFPKASKTGSAYRYCPTQDMTDKVDAARREARKCDGVAACVKGTKIGVLACMWLALYLIVVYVGEKQEIASFDPFKILDVDHSADAKDIKKAYRKLSLVYHPDKNPDDPAAASTFIRITKAYNALTDETAKANYEKYGNPDGPVMSKVGIGLPKFLLDKENHLMILCFFFFLLLFIVPMTFICYYQRTKNYAANGVMIETLQFLGYYINESTRVKNCPELLGASAESRAMLGRQTDNNDMKPVSQQVVEHMKRKFNVPIIVKNQFLIWAHMQRLHHLMTPELRSDCDEILKFAMRISQAMIEIACMREWFFTAQSMIEFRRCLVQGLDIKSDQLLQIPHFNEDTLSHAKRGKTAIKSMTDFISKDAEARKGMANMNPQQIMDVEAFCAHVTNAELKAVVEVEDEDAIVVGDVATVSCALRRKNLKENEAMGPVHAPLFPEPKFEEWWLFLVEAAPSTRIIAFERLRSTEAVIEEKLRFQVSRPGKHSLVLHALCDSYAGIDQKVELNFTALTEDEVKREIFVHKEDEDLDLQPTLFQQFMGELNHDDESEEEEEDGEKKEKTDKSDKSKKKPAGKKTVDKDIAVADDDDEVSTKKSGAADDDSDSDSSSDDED